MYNKVLSVYPLILFFAYKLTVAKRKGPYLHPNSASLSPIRLPLRGRLFPGQRTLQPVVIAVFTDALRVRRLYYYHHVEARREAAALVVETFVALKMLGT